MTVWAVFKLLSRVLATARALVHLARELLRRRGMSVSAPCWYFVMRYLASHTRVHANGPDGLSVKKISSLSLANTRMKCRNQNHQHQSNRNHLSSTSDESSYIFDAHPPEQLKNESNGSGSAHPSLPQSDGMEYPLYVKIKFRGAHAWL